MFSFWNITTREIRSLFVSPLAYVVLGLFSLGTGFYFAVSLKNFDAQLRNAQMRAQMMQNPDMLQGISLNTHLINNVTGFTFMLLLFLTPLFTMRLLTEERNNSTYELLMTSPISAWQISFGKFLAGGIFLFICLLTHSLFLGFIFRYGDPEFWPVVGTYLGLFLAGLSFIAIGLFTSSLTKHQMIAYILAVAINVGLLMIGWGAGLAEGNLSIFLQKTAITTHFGNFNQGVIQVSSTVYFLSLISLFVVATQISIRSITRSA